MQYICPDYQVLYIETRAELEELREELAEAKETLRDKFAMATVASGTLNPCKKFTDIARYAYVCADAMMKER